MVKAEEITDGRRTGRDCDTVIQRDGDGILAKLDESLGELPGRG